MILAAAGTDMQHLLWAGGRAAAQQASGQPQACMAPLV